MTLNLKLDGSLTNWKGNIFLQFDSCTDLIFYWTKNSNIWILSLI